MKIIHEEPIIIGVTIQIAFDDGRVATIVRGLPKAQRVGLCWAGFWQAGVFGRRYISKY